jgi:hypothetical protein
MYLVLFIYLGFQNKQNLTIEKIELNSVPNNQYMGPYTFIYVF